MTVVETGGGILGNQAQLGGQVLAAGLLVSMGVRFYYFPGADGTQFALDDAQGALLTLVVVIGTMNAVNFVDGLDGLAAGIVGIGASAFFLYCYLLSAQNNLTLATTGALLSAALAGACAGFLPHNFHPARLFMGDSGSLMLGLLLGWFAVRLSMADYRPALAPITAVWILALPIADALRLGLSDGHAINVAVQHGDADVDLLQRHERVHLAVRGFHAVGLRHDVA